MKHDLELTELQLLIRQDADKLNYFDRERKMPQLWAALARIHDNSRKAMWRMNELADKETQ